jgi:hypothetical protein
LLLPVAFYVAADLQRIFGPTHEERQWAQSVARSSLSQLALLVQLKIFQAAGVDITFHRNLQ